MYYYNGKFLLNREIDAIKVEDGKISWIGKSEDIPAGEEKTDLKGQTVLPAFVETHIHPTILAELVGKLSIMAPEVNGIEEMIEKLREIDKENPEETTVQGWGYDETTFLEERSPTRFDLDRVSREKLVKIQRSDLHNCVVNSFALEKLGIDKDYPDIEGGLVQRDQNGEPTGLLSEKAAFLVSELFEIKSEEEKIRKMVETSKVLAKYGIGSMTETLGMIDEKGDMMDLYLKAMEDGFLQDVAIYYLWNDTVAALSQEEIDKRKKGYTASNGATIKLSGIKYFLDGTISNGSAGMTKEFPKIEDTLYVKRDGHAPTEEDKNRVLTKGMMTGSKEELREIMKFAKEKGLQVKTHAMGDYSADILIELAEELGSWIEGTPSIRMEHGSTLRDDQIKKIHDLGIGVSGQSIFFYAEYKPYSKYLDEERFLQINRLRSLYDPGKLDYPYVALSNDAPSTYHPTPANPWFGIEPTVTRISLIEKADINQKEKLSLVDAFKLYTINAATINDMKNVGAIQEGYQANFIVIKEDLETLPEDQLHLVKASEVYIRGEKVEFK